MSGKPGFGGTWRIGSREAMAAVGRVLVVILLAALIGGAAYLMLWDIPAPRKPVEVTVPDDRLPK